MKRHLVLITLGTIGWSLCATLGFAITVDGAKDAEYGAAIAVQDTPTGFGDNGNELNAAYAKREANGDVSLLLTGNLEGNGNAIVIFIDSRAGGGIAGTNPDGSGNFGSIGGAKTDDWGTDLDGTEGVSTPPNLASILDAGFNPDFSIELNRSGGAGYFTNVIDLTLPNDPNPDRDIYLGVNAPDGTMAVSPYNRTDTNAAKGHGGVVTHALNNTNTAGVLGYDTTTPPGPLGDPLSATTGYEATFSAAFLANTGQPIRMMAFVTNGDGNFLANQFLGQAGLAGQKNLAGPGFEGGAPLFDATLFAGNQFFVIPAAGTLAGDYNNNGKVDTADYVVWRNDPTTNGGDPGGYNTWKGNYGIGGQAAGAGIGGTAVPEPSTVLIAVLYASLIGLLRRK